MSDQRIGHCLPLYLKNRILLSALEDDDALPQEAGEDRQVLAQFRERAADQAVALLEELYLGLVAGSGSIVPYRTDRRTQRRTVRERWYVTGRLYRKHERIPRAGWDILLGSLRDKGPAVTVVVGPLEPTAAAEMDDLSAAVAPVLGLDSANARHCFTHNAGYEVGVLAGFVPLAPGASYRDLIKGLRERCELFFNKFRSEFEGALDA